jgi:hypothetical protein
MVFPSFYNPLNRVCGAYASTDGGAFFSGTVSAGSPSCTASWMPGASNWSLVQNGLHALASNKIAVITAGSAPYAGPSIVEGVYLPTDDNDVFMTIFGSWQWGNFNTLGDAAQTSVDPGYPNQVALIRNNTYKTVDPPEVAPPMPTSAPPINILPPYPTNTEFDWGLEIGAMPDVTQVMTTDFSALPVGGDYIAVLNQGFNNCSAVTYDSVLRQYKTPVPGWVSISPEIGNFPSCSIGKIQAAGGHQNLVVYAMTNTATSSDNTEFNKGVPVFNSTFQAGQIYRGQIGPGGSIVTWIPASGTPPESLQTAVNFYVNPYDAKELYALDLGDDTVKYSVDSGGHWKVQHTLTALVSGYGEYRVGETGGTQCGTGRSVGGTDAFEHGCSLSDMCFDGFPSGSGVRVAALFYGGLALSRDGGADWMGLDLTDNNPLKTHDLDRPVVSCFFDAETHGPPPAHKTKPKIPGPDQLLYAAIKGRSIEAIVAPFELLESVNFWVKPSPLPSDTPVSVVVTAPASVTQRVPLRGPDAAGRYFGSLIFDYLTTASTTPAYTITYHYQVNTAVFPAESYTLSVGDRTKGVKQLPLQTLP